MVAFVLLNRVTVFCYFIILQQIIEPKVAENGNIFHKKNEQSH